MMNADGAIGSKKNSCDPACMGKICANVCCRAQLKLDDVFCKRCSCYICFGYDENKNPSFWLVCESESGTQDKPCGLSCHLECALKKVKAGKMADENGKKLDGSIQCGNCGNVNDLMSCCRKLLKEAKDIRNAVDFYSRINLCDKILGSTKKYQNLHGIVESIKRKLEEAAGSLDNLLPRMIVNRLSSGAELQKLCSQALELLDRIRLSNSECSQHEMQTCEGTEVTGSNLEGGLALPVPDLREEKSKRNVGLIMDLNELSENQRENNDFTNADRSEIRNLCAALPVVPSSHGIEDSSEGSKGIGALHTVMINAAGEDRECSNSPDGELGKSRNESAARPCGPSLCVSPPEGRQCRKGSEEKLLELGALHTMKQKHVDGYPETNYQQAVRVIRNLELGRHIDSNFRMEFITWFSNRASEKSKEQISVFIDIFSDDPPALADQLLHTFGEEIRAQKKLRLALNLVE